MTIKNYIFQGTWLNSNQEPNPDYCARAISDGRHRSQCENKVVEEIQGYGFCKQHAFEVKGKLTQHDPEGYFYQVHRYAKQIKEIPYSRQTASFYWDLRGNKIKKEQRYEGKLFDTEEEAKTYVLEKARSLVKGLKAKLVEAEAQLAELERAA